MDITDIAVIYWPADMQALLIGAVVIIGGTALALWWDAKRRK